MSITIPDVPFGLGIPPVIRSQGATALGVATLLNDAIVGPQEQRETQWGIYDLSGNRVLVGDNTISFEIVSEARISTHPVEGGGFASYNKVDMPINLRLEITKTGTRAEKAAFLDALETFRSSVELFDIMTPEKTYLNVTFGRYDYSRTAEQGASMLIVSIAFEEVRITAESKFSNEKAPGALTPQNGGAVQTKAPSPPVTGTPS